MGTNVTNQTCHFLTYRKMLSNLGKLLPVLLLLFFISEQAIAQTAPVTFETIDRPARTEVSFGQPMVRYAPGFIDPVDGTLDYESPDADIVYRLEFAVNNDGSRSLIPETSRFQLTVGGNDFLPFVRNVRDGVLREPYDEVVTVRLVDGYTEDTVLGPAPGGRIRYTNTKDTNLLQLCTDDNTSGEVCNDVANINKNSYFHSHTDPHRGDVGAAFPDIAAVDGGTTAEQECYNAYVEVFWHTCSC